MSKTIKILEIHEHNYKESYIFFLLLHPNVKCCQESCQKSLKVLKNVEIKNSQGTSSM